MCLWPEDQETSSAGKRLRSSSSVRRRGQALLSVGPRSRPSVSGQAGSPWGGPRECKSSSPGGARVSGSAPLRWTSLGAAWPGLPDGSLVAAVPLVLAQLPASIVPVGAGSGGGGRRPTRHPFAPCAGWVSRLPRCVWGNRQENR